MNNIQDVWKEELLILKEVDRICKKYSIPYYAEAGTLLGAIRHQGFIPWDDDIDLAMFRKDFNRFRKIAKTELDGAFFCQSGYSDKGFYGGMLHIRKNGTTAILARNFPHSKFHQGIFIDIFPLDGVIENKILRRIQDFCKKICVSIMANKNSKRTNNFSLRYLLKRIILFLPSLLPQKFLYCVFESICGWKKACLSKFVGLVSYDIDTGKRLSSSYEVSFADFEDTKIPIPKDYDEVLASQYGSDYMTPKHTPTDHGEVFFDTKHSYEDYLSGKLKIPEGFFEQCQNR